MTLRFHLLKQAIIVLREKCRIVGLANPWNEFLWRWFPLALEGTELNCPNRSILSHK